MLLRCSDSTLNLQCNKDTVRNIVTKQIDQHVNKVFRVYSVMHDTFLWINNPSKSMLYSHKNLIH